MSASYRHQGNVSQMPTVRIIFEAVTGNSIAPGTRLPIQGSPYLGWFDTKQLRFVTQGDLMYIQQNKRTTSKYAQMAREGAKILWVINQKTNEYAGYILNGEVFVKER